MFEDALQHISPIWYRQTKTVAERGEGYYLYDHDGTRYLDFTCRIEVTNIGHCHPRVVEAIRGQAGLLLHGQANIALHPRMLELIKELTSIVALGLEGFFFSDSAKISVTRRKAAASSKQPTQARSGIF